MFCNQCEETARGCACTARGVCGKDPETAGLQDVLIWVCRGLATAQPRGGRQGEPGRRDVHRGCALRHPHERRLRPRPHPAPDPRGRRAPQPSASRRTGRARGERLGSHGRRRDRAKAGEIAADAAIDDDIHSLRTLLLAGLKGLAAYGEHAGVLGFNDEGLDSEVVEILAATADDLTMDQLAGLVERTGKACVAAMALLDRANTTTYGHPRMTRVSLGVRNRPGILVSGHDLRDLQELLEQTADDRGRRLHPRRDAAGAGVPGLPQAQALCRQLRRLLVEAERGVRHLQRPDPDDHQLHHAARDAYRARIFTTGMAGYPGVPHIADRVRRRPARTSRRSSTWQRSARRPRRSKAERSSVGFARDQIEQLADKVVAAVKSGRSASSWSWAAATAA